MSKIPEFRGDLRKNDALFMFGAVNPLPFVYIYEQRDVEIVHGPSCRVVRDEIYVQRCDSDGVRITQRRGGGGTVVLAPGMIVSIIVGTRKKEQTALAIFNSVHAAFITTLDSAGAKGVTTSGISDLAIGEKKVLGSSLYMGRDPMLFYYQSSLMVNSDISLIGRYLRHPPREPDYRRGRDHEEFCTTLCDQGYSGSVAELKVKLETGLPELLR